MKVQLAGIELTNPVIAASGTFGYGIEFEEIVSLERIGGFVTKGISLEPMTGHAGHLNDIEIGCGQYNQRNFPQGMRVVCTGVLQAAQVVLEFESPRLDEWKHFSQCP